jgi:hypothetical protein
VRGTSGLLAITAAALIGCSAAQPSVVRADDQPFAAPFADSSGWQPAELGPIPGAPSRFVTIDALLNSVRQYLAAGIKTPRPNSGVTIAVPPNAAAAEEVHVVATMIGGANAPSSGSQYRLTIRRDDQGWWLVPAGEMIIYCDHLLAGASRTMCL